MASYFLKMLSILLIMLMCFQIIDAQNNKNIKIKIALGSANKLLNMKGTILNTRRSVEEETKKNERLNGFVPTDELPPIEEPLYKAKCFNAYYDIPSINQMELYNDFVKIFEWEKSGLPFDPKMFGDRASSGVTNNRFAGMCIRMAFHDNSIADNMESPQEYIQKNIDINGNWVGIGRYLPTSGADASVLICPEERYHPNQNYDETASRILRSFQFKSLFGSMSLVEKWNLSYADLLHNCAASAAIYMTHAVPEEAFKIQPMIFGRKDACFYTDEKMPNSLERFKINNRYALCGPTEFLPSLDMNAIQLNNWFISRGMSECLWMSLMGTHTTMDNMILPRCLRNLPHITNITDVLIMNHRASEKRYFDGSNKKLDYFSYFLGQGNHKPQRPFTDPELPNCDWLRDNDTSKIYWPMTIADCELGLQHVKSHGKSLSALANMISNFATLKDSWTNILPCALAICSGKGLTIVETCPNINLSCIPNLKESPKFGGYFNALPAHPKSRNTLILPTIEQSTQPTQFNIMQSPVGSQCFIPGQTYEVDGFPGTPFEIQPFTQEFQSPPTKQHSFKECRNDSHCIQAYEIDISSVQLRVFDTVIPGCKNYDATWFLGYDKMVPGPTIRIASGIEKIIRFHNNIGKEFIKEPHAPCTNPGRTGGHPVSIHFHGSASLAPYDGWAEDETCSGESKEYILPNNRPGTSWYHDHALHVTADNAYLGLAGFSIVSSKIADGGCGEPFNLENIEEIYMMMHDVVLDNKCQLFMDKTKFHKNNLYGDINMVNGVAFPHMSLQPKWYRFRLLVSSVSRPYIWGIHTPEGNPIHSEYCWVIATDGGYRNTPVQVPESGIRIGVAERYEVVCDLSNFASQTLYITNMPNKNLVKDVPYFCHSHLVSKITVGPLNSITDKNGIFDVENSANIFPEKPLTRVLSQDNIATARQMINEGNYHRLMQFGRTNGQWTINGETWTSFKIAADNVGQNTWELWKFETGGGWFHPIHIHLVDFFVLMRDDLRPYEIESPKDVFYLGNSEVVWVIARFGPHKGDYMFHCHNLIHEDNDMLRAFSIKHHHGSMNEASAEKFVANPLYGIIYNNWNYADPVTAQAAAKETSLWPTFDKTYINQRLHENVYRIFYPLPEDETYIQQGFINPWKSSWQPKCDTLQNF